MGKIDSNTSFYLSRWNNGDEKGLEALIERHLPWVRNYVHKLMGPVLQARGETTDYVQDAMVQFLQYGPKIHISNAEHFRSLLARIIQNTLCDKYDWFTRLRRNIHDEDPLPPEMVLCLDPPDSRKKTPSMSAADHEEEAWVRLGLELLSEEYREVLLLRKWENLTFGKMGARLGITEIAARMKHNRAVRKLGSILTALRFGQIEKIVEGKLESAEEE